MRNAFRSMLLAPLCGLLLAGCEQLGIEDPAKAAAAKEAEGRAIGSACRHSGRPLEDCYKLNAKAQKAAIFAGWREMDAYMRENGIQTAQSASNAAEAATKNVAAAPEPAPAEKTPAAETAPAGKK